MNRILRGAVVLAASALFAGCNTEPEATQGGDPFRIVVNPAAVFVDRGDSNAVLIRLVDDQGTSLNSPISITNVTPGLSIFVDSMFRPTFNPDGSLQAETRNTELRVFVKGVGLEAGSFTVTAGGLTEEVDVTVTPIEMTPTLSTAAPNIIDVFTLTAEPGLTFTPGTQLVDATGAAIAITNSVSGDGTTATFQVLPEYTGGAFEITGVVPAYAPTLQVTIPSTVELAPTGTVGTPLAGTADIATAPVLNPLDGHSVSGVVDAGVFTGDYFGFPANYYRLDVTETSIVDFLMTWGGGEDLGLYYVDAEGNDLGIIADDHGSGAAASPEEHAEVELDPGTYYLVVVQFPGATPDPTAFALSITPH